MTRSAQDPAETDLSALRLVGELPDGVVRLSVPPGRHVLGSGPGSDLRLRDRSVSRTHAVLVVDGEGGAWVEDLDSTNGTFVDGERVDRQSLAAAHELSFGSVHLTVERVDPDDLVTRVALESSARDALVEESSLAQTTIDGSLTAALGGIVLPELLRRSEAETNFQSLADWTCQTLSSQSGLLGAEVHRSGDSSKRGVLASWGETKSETSAGEESDELLEATVALGTEGTLTLRVRLDPSEAEPRLGQLLQTLARALSLVWKAQSAPEALRESVQITPDCVEPPRPPSQVESVRAVYRQARAVAPSELGVLILGETGTGKELLAHYLYECSASSKDRGPFLAINCAALATDLLEAELFGIEKGVATGVEARPGKFEEAHGGTLFLDEIGEMPDPVQAAILRVLQEKQVQRIGSSRARPCEVRVLSATNRDLGARVEAGLFRRDLYYRIAGCTLELPPLCERTPDIVNLAAHFAERESRRLAKDVVGLSSAAVTALCSFSWPGNVRQLRSELARAVALTPHGELLAADALSAEVRAGSARLDTDLSERVARFERREIAEALARNEQDAGEAAKELGISRATLYRKLQD